MRRERVTVHLKLPAWLFGNFADSDRHITPLVPTNPTGFRACDNARMKFSAISLGLLALLTPLSAAWMKEGMFSVSFCAVACKPRPTAYALPSLKHHNLSRR